MAKKISGSKSRQSKKAAKSRVYSPATKTQHVQEQETKYKRTGEAITSKLRAIGNSKGVILNSQLIEAAGINANDDITIRADKGKIIIEAKKEDVNTNLASWDNQFKQAIKSGTKPEKDLFDGMENDFDKKEW